ncbi:hypothetical protein ABVS_0691 [Acinetobacter lwoffii]|nr:hypothetical protein ABVS_0691 [Acinetobacter lwoffii]
MLTPNNYKRIKKRIDFILKILKIKKVNLTDDIKKPLHT